MVGMSQMRSSSVQHDFQRCIKQARQSEMRAALEVELYYLSEIKKHLRFFNGKKNRLKHIIERDAMSGYRNGG